MSANTFFSTMNKKFVLLIIILTAVIGGVLFLKTGNFGTQLLWDITKEGSLLLPLVLVSALIDSINPCAFSILLITIAFLLSIKSARSRILSIGGAYIFGIFLVYILIGLGIFQTLHLFNTPHFMAKVGAVVLILFGTINLINEFFPSFPIKLRIPVKTHQAIGSLMEKGSLPAALFLGLLVGLCEFPCTGGPYLMVLGLLHDSATYLRGFLYLLLYNFVFVLPLVIILLMACDSGVLSKVEDWRSEKLKEMRLITGIIMTALGILIFFL
ncbi:MAG: hypothetical protein A2249_02155 [Candidatus Jacksonbacteria bacterium RIFOXYA2_FULL_44_7]|uniref:Uncharacterized protein n=1 Tax=Candidatus Jacksonbacteria bacterium RIFCSPLOWO2_02_FULL_44_20 TaxID=1798460 RepID=A0A1G2A8V4_9BACT|nr:MAG: hypothetical protein UW39_C0032G0005 [Parcubacteria group bacterium GW2011_GWC2_44_17]KKT48280.1 MAG: hypothetical protein UW40_C0048G0004 [Parcubacteria group bacterium GW2011_GWF2_44_17]OGY73328.1 MAG: hypothetical protein A3H61_00185 [Candidatus Jacksonbacteria bacterium RIFCSPLOWO2_02_FULL_44_20]OGY75978.1 MAG: hypothetical protein A2249_02155 [Candidatus Jacksonbacteria bacterium RIFOXYA2_FULL_44_7]HCA67584.1 hypothetical protein [Candidatus Jacksonbacteria bacterium]